MVDFIIDRLASVLPAMAGTSVRDVSIDSEGLIRMRGPDDRLIIAEAVDRPSRAAVLDAWTRVRGHAEAAGAVPVLLLPRLTRSLRDLAEHEGFNWVDFGGNARIDAAPLRVWIEGRPVEFPQRRQGVNPFSGRSLNLVRVLLVDRRRRWRQKDLVAASGLSQPRASKVLVALEELALVRREEDGAFLLIDPEGLLDAWADAHSYLRQGIVPVHMTGDGIELARSVSRRLDDPAVDHWFTGLPAAWAYDHFARFRLVSVFVSVDPGLLVGRLGLRHVERGANVHLIPAGEQRLEIGAQMVDGLKCAHPGQVYVDLLGLPERAAEAAEHLRPRVFAEGGR